MGKPDLRLTLRTLLAFLDDTLDPAQAREIGRKVNRSTAARGIIGRIRALLRSAPASVPSTASVNPNDLAEYLDNVLDGERMAALERRLLDSDAHLTETAALHQVLSTLATAPPEPVPGEIQHRLYDLPAQPAFNGVSAAGLGLDSLIEPVPASTPPEQAVVPRRVDRPLQHSTAPLPFAPPTFAMDQSATRWWAIVIALVVTAVVLAIAMRLPPWSGVEPNQQAPPMEQAPLERPLSTTPAPTAPIEPAKSSDTPERPAQKSAEPFPPAPIGPTPKIVRPETIPPAPAQPEKPAAPTPAAPREPVAPVDETATLAVCASDTGLLLRRTAGGFERLAQGTEIRGRDELVHLAGMRSKLDTPAQFTIEVVNDTRLHVRSDANVDLALDLIDGRLAARSGARPATLRLAWRAASCVITLAPNAAVGVESRRADPSGPASLTLQTLRGLIRLSHNASTVQLAGGDEIEWPAGAAIGTPRPAERPFAWLAESEDRGTDEGPRGLARQVPLGQRVEPSLRRATADERRDVRLAAVNALTAIADVWGLLDVVRTSTYSEVRSPAIGGLRRLRQDAAHWRLVRARLAELYNETTAEVAVSLIAGFSDSNQPPRDIQQYLGNLLESDERIIRELAIFNLKELTGHDFAYQADAPAYRRASSIQQFRRWLQTQ
jgi:hypothetical protein